MTEGSVLGPMIFNTFIKDFFFNIKLVKLTAYADNEKLIDSDADPAELDRHIVHAVQIANSWYRCNGMIANVTNTKLQLWKTGL